MERLNQMRVLRFTGVSMSTMVLMASLPQLPEESRKPEPKEPRETEALPLPDMDKLNRDSSPIRLEPQPLEMDFALGMSNALPIRPLSDPMEYALSADHPHQHTTIGPSKLCQGCGRKLSGAEVRTVRERQAKAEHRQRWDERQYLKRGV